MYYLIYGEYGVLSINRVLEQVSQELFLTSCEPLDESEESRGVSLVARSAGYLDGVTFYVTEERALAEASRYNVVRS
jgi:hypothetical protein